MDAILKKSLALLEKNVEWLAVGLAALFLGWMLYDYVFQKPVTATVAGQQLTPGDVDPAVNAGPAEKLRAEMSSTVVPPQLHAPEDFVADLERRLDPAATAIVAFAAPWTPSLPIPADQLLPPEHTLTVNGNPVTALPMVAAPEDLKVEQGRSSVQVPPTPTAGANGGSGSALVQLTGNDATPSDRNWVSISAMIRIKPLAAELNQKKIPAALKHITMLRVDLVRQEQDGNGNWGEEHVIGPLSTVNMPALPASDADPADQNSYVQWAEKPDAQEAILQPPFYNVLQADAWVVPGLPQPQGVGQLANLNFDPATYTGDRDDLTPEQQKELDDYRKAQAAEKAAAARARAAAAAQRSQSQRGGFGGPGGAGGPPGGYGGPGGGGGGGGGGRVVDDPDRPLTLAQAGPGGYGQFGGGFPPGFRPPGPPPGFFGGRPPGFSPPPSTPTGTQVDPNNPRTTAHATLPQGAFDPSTAADIVCWAHDDTVAPGKTYRYKIRYIIKNPVFKTTNVAQPQSLADQFEIVSKDSDWTDPLSVKAETNLFAVSSSPLRNGVPVKFDIFRWKTGAWQKQSVEVEAGDLIGAVDPVTKTDFSTGLTLVDVRPDPRNIDDRIITLTTDSGQLLQHDLNADRTNPDHKKLNTTVNSQPKPTAPSAAGAAAATAAGLAGGPPRAPGDDRSGP